VLALLVVKFFINAIDARWLMGIWPCPDVNNQYISREIKILRPAGRPDTRGDGGWTVGLMPTRFELNCVIYSSGEKIAERGVFPYAAMFRC